MKTYTPKKGTTIKYVTSDEVRRYSDLGTTSVMVDETGALLTNFDRS